MTECSVTLCISSVRSRGIHGGVILAGKTCAGGQLTVTCSYRQVPDSSFPEKGQLWFFSGKLEKKELAVNGKEIVEDHIHADRADYLKPVGKHIIRWIADCPDIRGVGESKAKKLYENFGSDLVTIIDSGREEILEKVVSSKVAGRICRAFEKAMVGKTRMWLETIGIPSSIAKKVACFYGNSATAEIEKNPYVLINFSAQWRVVDEFAKSRFGVGPGDQRRLEAAMEEALYRGLKNGHTCLTRQLLRNRLETLLEGPELVDKALAQKSTAYLRFDDQTYQSFGVHVIERTIAERVSSLLRPPHDDLIFPENTEVLYEQINGVIDTYADCQRLVFSQDQRDAIICCVRNRFSCIFSGPGTGKYIVLKGIYEVINALMPETTILQIAISANTARRMTEATGRKSTAIKDLIGKPDETPLSAPAVVVIDHASMLDAILLFRLFKLLPQNVRIILAGDPAELPPVGPGLIFHSFYEHSLIPQVELKEVKLQPELSSIPIAAQMVRTRATPQFPKFSGVHAGISVAECARNRINETTISIYEELGGSGSNFDIQILCAMRSGIGGSESLNVECHNRFSPRTELVRIYSPQFGVAGAKSAERLEVYVGDLVVNTQLNSERGLINGAIGRVKSTCNAVEADSACCIVEFDGAEVALQSADVGALTHAYAMTIQNSRAHQFRRVIVPIRQSRLLDCSLIYTAMTRGVEQVVLVGEIGALRDAIKHPNSAWQRNTNLAKILGSMIH